MNKEGNIKEFNQLVELALNNEKKILSQKTEIRSLKRQNDDEKKNFLCNLIETIDAFERKEENIHEKYDEAEAKKIIKNFTVVKKRMLKILHSYNVVEVELEHSNIDCSVCMIVETIKDETKQNDFIAEVLKKGYKMNDNILRQAEIIIVKNM